MLNFTYYNPVKIVFGKGTIKELPKLIPAENKVMMIYGGGSIKQNGVYDQVAKAMAGRPMVEFGGIEPNPRYETCIKCVESIRKQGSDFLLAVGGGSVLDAAKFIAASFYYSGDDPWDFMKDASRVPPQALPLGSVLTLPATGSEMNSFAVISRDSTQEKLAFRQPPSFSQVFHSRSDDDLFPAAAANGQRHRGRLCPRTGAIHDLRRRLALARPAGRGDIAHAHRRRSKGNGQSEKLHRPIEHHVVRDQCPQRADRLRSAARLVPRT